MNRIGMNWFFVNMLERLDEAAVVLIFVAFLFKNVRRAIVKALL